MLIILLTFFFALSGKDENERCLFVKYLSGYNLFVHVMSGANIAPFFVAFALTLFRQKGTKLRHIHTQLSLAKLTAWYLQY